MKIEKRRFFPTVESLESILALSGLPASAALAQVEAMGARTIALTGSVSGPYHARSIPDAGKTYTFTKGSGKVSPLGQVSLTGNVELPGLLISTGGVTNPVYANGMLVIANGKGALTLRLSAPSTDNAATLPRAFAFKITGATGAYKGDTGGGWISIQVIPASRSLAPGGQEHGKFHLEFLSVPPPAPAPTA